MDDNPSPSQDAIAAFNSIGLWLLTGSCSAGRSRSRLGQRTLGIAAPAVVGARRPIWAKASATPCAME